MELRSLRPAEREYWLDFVAQNSGRTRSEVIERVQMERRLTSRHLPGHQLPGLQYSGPQLASYPFAVPQPSEQPPTYSPDDGVIRVATVNERIVGSLRLTLRVVCMAGRAIPVGGIADLCTDEAYRGQGVASQLLMDAVRVMARRDVPLSLLFAERQTLFARMGWRPVPLELCRSRISVADLPRDETVQVTVAHPLDPSEARQMQALYESFIHPFQGSVDRTDMAYWQNWISRRWQNGLLARRNGRVVAYLAARWTDEDQLTVDDFAAQPEETPYLFQRLCAAAARMRSLESVDVCYPAALPVDLPQQERQRLSGPMYRVTTPRVLPLEAAQVLDRLIQGHVEQHLIFPVDWF